MSSRLDKNSKIPAGKAKESSSSGKAKPAGSATSKSSAKPKAKPAPAAKAASVNAKASDKTPTKTAKPAAATKAPSTKAKAKTKANSKTQAPASQASAEGLGLEEFSIALIKPGESKERIWRTKSFQQMNAQREFGFPDAAPELPSLYHEDKLVLMPKDPEYMFCYWELTPILLDDRAKAKVPEGNYRETLKINWESKSLFEPNFTFIPIFFWARKWYFGVPQVGQQYQVELGWLSDTGHFIPIIRSNLSELPESWAQTQKRLAEQGDVLAYAARNSKILGSSENVSVEDTRAFAPEWNLSSESFSSSSWSRAAGQGGAESTSGPEAVPTSKARKPSGKAAAPRLEISGKVIPGTQVAVGGKPVATDGLGFFKTEFPYEKDILSLEITDRAGSRRSFAYDLKELVLT